MIIQPASDQTLLIILGDSISIETHKRVVKLLRLLEVAAPAGVRNLHPAYTSIMIQFDACRTSYEELERAVREQVEHLDSVELPARHR